LICLVEAGVELVEQLALNVLRVAGKVAVRPGRKVLTSSDPAA